jgi:hypothetical protein
VTGLAGTVHARVACTPDVADGQVVVFANVVTMMPAPRTSSIAPAGLCHAALRSDRFANRSSLSRRSWTGQSGSRRFACYSALPLAVVPSPRGQALSGSQGCKCGSGRKRIVAIQAHTASWQWKQWNSREH